MLLAAVLLTPSAQEVPDFQRDVRPLLADRCFACHGPDAAARKADLRLDVRTAEVLEGGAPTLLARVTATEPGERMPPPDAHADPLDGDEVATLRGWLEAGAPYEEHWSYAPLAGGGPPANG